MAQVILPEKDEFTKNVAAISNRIQSVSNSNPMAKLLHSNFQSWLNTSATSPVKLTQDLDVNNDGVISGDEFANLLGKMTGERPPEWVVEVVFSFVNANPDSGIPVADWMAFLAACGLTVPDELFLKPVIITGSVLLDVERTLVHQPLTVTVSFNEPVESYQFTMITLATGEEEAVETVQADMDSPTFDEFVLEADEPGEYQLVLSHMGVRLDEARFIAEPRPVVEPPVTEADETEILARDTEQNEAENIEPVAQAPPVASNDFTSLIEAFQSVRLRSDTDRLLSDVNTYGVRFTVLSLERTLMGEGAYRNGITLTCMSEEGDAFELMTRADERVFTKGQSVEANVVPHAWSMALRQLICREA